MLIDVEVANNHISERETEGEQFFYSSDPNGDQSEACRLEATIYEANLADKRTRGQGDS